jgi:hypothetical protein
MLVLKTLSTGPMHGYGIAAHIKRLSNDVLQVDEGSLYPALQRMRQRGWLTADGDKLPTSGAHPPSHASAAGNLARKQDSRTCSPPFTASWIPCERPTSASRTLADVYASAAFSTCLAQPSPMRNARFSVARFRDGGGTQRPARMAQRL